ncbi:single-stranded DNA-binding protein, mitochondrial [Cimex lectularius]|uniref:Single-stranded DNA-binding protein, mitochondrial n=1 Tax=Cimex lectularius TaxID=79782 RepID=A0A8I6RAA9_CIMLE|nr:single-stranded DNA-binding protein, mitochondrial [Cimex lectularius]
MFKVLQHLKPAVALNFHKNIRTMTRTLQENAILEKTINNVTLLGRVGSVPVKKGTDKNSVVIFSIATHNNFRHETGEMVQKTDWHRICVFKPSLQELVFNNLKKGQRLHVSGRLTYGSSKEENNYKQTASIIAEEIIFFQSFERNDM